MSYINIEEMDIKGLHHAKSNDLPSQGQTSTDNYRPLAADRNRLCFSTDTLVTHVSVTSKSFFIFTLLFFLPNKNYFGDISDKSIVNNIKTETNNDFIQPTSTAYTAKPVLWHTAACPHTYMEQSNHFSRLSKCDWRDWIKLGSKML